ncbi:hypothetical protein EJ08DRAFT_162039 [Tothia fuscella]|uniref:RING-type domain-containing protein n=1 Tax=Tothia fuscella TaxID=1048955 RepID=A0A9P4TZ37_9PEZI|nr:hypothetical protein EJ08DRAFT_162039 [Tothia fuscella]
MHSVHSSLSQCGNYLLDKGYSITFLPIRPIFFVSCLSNFLFTPLQLLHSLQSHYSQTLSPHQAPEMSDHGDDSEIPPSPDSDPGNAHPRRSHLLRSLRAVPIEDVPESQRTCPICQEDYTEHEPPTRLPCGHFAGLACMRHWFESRYEYGGLWFLRNTCPMRCQLFRQTHTSPPPRAEQLADAGLPADFDLDDEPDFTLDDGLPRGIFGLPGSNAFDGPHGFDAFTRNNINWTMQDIMERGRLDDDLTAARSRLTDLMARNSLRARMAGNDSQQSDDSDDSEEFESMAEAAREGARVEHLEALAGEALAARRREGRDPNPYLGTGMRYIDRLELLAAETIAARHPGGLARTPPSGRRAGAQGGSEASPDDVVRHELSSLLHEHLAHGLPHHRAVGVVRDLGRRLREDPRLDQFGRQARGGYNVETRVPRELGSTTLERPAQLRSAGQRISVRDRYNTETRVPRELGSTTQGRPAQLRTAGQRISVGDRYNTETRVPRELGSTTLGRPAQLREAGQRITTRRPSRVNSSSRSPTQVGSSRSPRTTTRGRPAQLRDIGSRINTGRINSRRPSTDGSISAFSRLPPRRVERRSPTQRSPRSSVATGTGTESRYFPDGVIRRSSFSRDNEFTDPLSDTLLYSERRNDGPLGVGRRDEGTSAFSLLPDGAARREAPLFNYPPQPDWIRVREEERTRERERRNRSRSGLSEAELERLESEMMEGLTFGNDARRGGSRGGRGYGPGRRLD